MTALYIILIVLQAGIIVFFIMRRGKKTVVETKQPPSPDINSHAVLRNTALHVTPDNLKIKIPDTENLVYGVVMDWNLGDTLVTLVSYITGAASMYLSSGGAILGSGKNPTVGEAASELVTMAQDYVNKAVPVASFDLPPKDCVRFYLLTNHYKLAAQEQTAFFDNAVSSWLPLFAKANEVISEMRAGLN